MLNEICRVLEALHDVSMSPNRALLNASVRRETGEDRKNLDSNVVKQSKFHGTHRGAARDAASQHSMFGARGILESAVMMTHEPPDFEGRNDGNRLKPVWAKLNACVGGLPECLGVNSS